MCARSAICINNKLRYYYYYYYYYTPFENHTKVLKKYVRKRHQPLQQAVKQYNECITYKLKSDVNKNISNSITLKNNHANGPLIKELAPFSSIQYKTMIFNNFEIKINHESDSFT